MPVDSAVARFSRDLNLNKAGFPQQATSTSAITRVALPPNVRRFHHGPLFLGHVLVLVRARAIGQRCMFSITLFLSRNTPFGVRHLSHRTGCLG